MMFLGATSSHPKWVRQKWASYREVSVNGGGVLFGGPSMSDPLMLGPHWVPDSNPFLIDHALPVQSSET